MASTSNTTDIVVTSSQTVATVSPTPTSDTSTLAPTTRSTSTIPTTSSSSTTSTTSTTSTSSTSTTSTTSSSKTTESSTTTTSASSETQSVTTVTSTKSNELQSSTSSVSSAAATSSAAGLATPNSSNSGSSADPKTIAIATVIPIVVVLLAVIAGIWFWRKRRDRRNNEEMRRKEMEEYGFNPNNDPSLPPVGSAVEEESATGYRGWGTTSTARKASTNMSSQPAMARSDSGGRGMNGQPSPPAGGTRYSDGNSGDPLVHSQNDGVAALGVAPAAAGKRGGGIARGPSNASSAYSLGNYSDVSALSDGPLPNEGPQDYGAFVHPDESGHHNGNNAWGGQPVIQDVSARRNTQIENPPVSPHQGSMGISQNF